MQSQIESERLAVRANLITTDRPDSSQVVDLHIYIIPKHVWKDHQNLAENEAMEQAISAGFVRVPQNLTIYDLRQHILDICGQDEEFPKEFIYLRSVGRCLAKVRSQQETDLRVKNYRPPITVAPEIYLLEGHHDDDSSMTPNSKSYLFRESPIRRSLINSPQVLINSPQRTRSRQQSWVKSIAAPPPLPTIPTRHSSVHSNERQNTTILNGPATFSNLSASSSILSARDLAKLREEQERLRLRQIELARQRREIEQQQQQRQEKESLEKHENGSKERQEKEEAAAVRIQATYRGYQSRRKIKDERQKRQLAGNEIERLQKEARELTRRKAEEEHAEEIQAHDVVKYSDRLEELLTKRIELEASRETIVRRMQQLHAQISVRRKEERDLWKQKYLMEKKKTSTLEERTRAVSKDQSNITSQIEQAKIRFNNSSNLRQQAENECRVLRQELQQVRMSMNTIEKHPLPKQMPPPPFAQQQQQQTIPINLDITLQY